MGMTKYSSVKRFFKDLTGEHRRRIPPFPNNPIRIIITHNGKKSLTLARNNEQTWNSFGRIAQYS